ncbi:MAG: DUF5123 domain-containing protein [Dysgonamonadaceae bacterium]|jgi:hypothetical protein|nr:DUF5123 domain-containing protein [Dysgonamonadaceae bacterium]
MKKYKIIELFAVMLFAMLSCQEQSEMIDELDFDREFSPLQIEVETVNHNSATISWKAMKGSTEHYDLQLFQGDSLTFAGSPAVETNVQYVYEYKFENLLPEVQYSVRIKTLGDAAEQDSKWHGVAFKTSSEQILTSVKNIKATLATVCWTPGETATHLLFTATGEADVTVNLTTADVAAGSKTLEKNTLKSDKTWQVSIYNGIGRRGKLSFKTLYVPSGANVVSVDAGTDIVTLMGDADNIGKILLLPDGYESTTGGNKVVTLVGGMTIYGDPDAEVQPKIISERTGGNPAMAPATGTNIDYLKFFNVEILCADPTQGVSLFDWNSIVTESGTLEFDHCYIHDFGRSLLRLRAGSKPQSVQNLIITDCVFANMGGTGSNNIFVYTGADALLKNITISKSTFYDLDLGSSFMQFPGTGANLTQSISISECTFHDVVGSNATARYFIESSATNVTLDKNIFGKTKDAVSGGASPMGIKTTGAVTQTGNFKASEWGTVAGEGTVNIDGAAAGSFSSLFENAGTGNFTLKSGAPNAAKSAGDPRWR